MSLSNCSRCGRVFASVSGARDVCPACLRQEDEDFKKVFQFFSTRPTATAEEISEATGVDLKDIYRFVRENRLRLARVDGILSCESCGAPIPQGKICDNCRKRLSDEMKKDIDNIRHSPKSRKIQEPHEPKYLKDRRRDNV